MNHKNNNLFLIFFKCLKKNCNLVNSNPLKNMKKIILTFIIIISLYINAFAQYKPFQFGLNIAPGVNISKLNSDNVSNNLNTMSFNWGFKGNFYFVENYGFSTGFNILNIKSGYDYINNDRETISRKINNQYLEIPLSLMMRTEKIDKLRIFGNVGYGFGICLNSKQEDLYKGKTIETENEFDYVRHGLIIKLGVEFNVYKSSCLTAALAYNSNFANIYKTDNTLEHDVFLNNLCLEIGFMF